MSCYWLASMDDTYNWILRLTELAQGLDSDDYRALFPGMLKNELCNRICFLMQDKYLIVQKESVHDEFVYLVPQSSSE